MSLRPLLSLVAVTSLAACATTAPPNLPLGPTAADNHRIQVTQAAERLNLSVAPDTWSLDAQARNDLSRFARAYSASGHGAMVLSTPSGGSNADAAARLAQEARIFLSEAGVPYGAIVGATHDSSGAADAPIVLSFVRYEAAGPDCAPLWTQDLAHPVNNQAYESFGCATVSNLAAMIEDPRDLLGPRDETARDSGRRGVVFDQYRQGQQTHSTRSEDERVTISNAVD